MAGIACLSMLVPAGTAGAHRNVCHMHHACPSDHATYRWHGLLCVKPTSPKNDGSFHKRVRQGGLPYLCKR
ncbi:MAG TPA: hypothetical protein VH834_15575 [Solirubrobacteraceae bacterium]